MALPSHAWGRQGPKIGTDFWFTPTRATLSLEFDGTPTNTPPGVSMGIVVLAGLRSLSRSRTKRVPSAGLAGLAGWAGLAGLGLTSSIFIYILIL